MACRETKIPTRVHAFSDKRAKPSLLLRMLLLSGSVMMLQTALLLNPQHTSCGSNCIRRCRDRSIAHFFLKFNILTLD